MKQALLQSSVMLSALILLVCEHPDRIITDTIVSFRNAVSLVEKPWKSVA